MIKKIFKMFLSSFFFLFRYYYRNRLIVLAYHDIKDVFLFERHLQLIRRYYHPVRIEELEGLLSNGQPLPQYAVLVTLDDGDSTLKKNGAYLMNKYHIPAVAFVISGNIQRREKFWWRIIEDYFVQKGQGFKAARKEVKRLKGRSNRERINVLKRIGEEYPALLMDQDALTKSDLNALVAAGITIGSHTASHPILNRCTPEELDYEFRESKAFFVNFGLKTFRYFAYPNGDYNASLIPLLEQYGIAFAFTFDHRINKKIIPRFMISRIRVNSTDSLPEFKIRIAGISSIFNR